MFWPKNLLPDLERFLVERFGFGVLAFSAVQLTQVIEARGSVGMLRARKLFPNRQRPLVKGFSFRVLALVDVKHSQVVKARAQNLSPIATAQVFLLSRDRW
jgi:hypothetical protein